jgi:uncharacterized linocin/CFP29 family protein
MPGELATSVNPGSNGLLYAGGGEPLVTPSLSRLATYHQAANGNSRAALAAYRASRPLPEDAQRMLDNTLIRVGRQRLNIVSDLLNAGLTFDLPNWLAVPTIQWERIGEGGSARRTMVPKARGERFILDMTPASLPVYCTWADFSFDIRTLLAAERAGYNIDTAHAEMSVRNVNITIEDQAVRGAGLQVTGGFTAPGFFTSGFAVNTDTFVDNEAWTASGHSGEDIHGDVVALIELLQADKFYGPYRLYVPMNYWNKLQFDYKSGTSGSTMERILDGMDGVLSIRMSEHLPADKVLLVQMTSDVVDVITGQQPTLVSWEDGPGWERFFVVMACIIVRIKSNILGNQGFAIGSPS